jgi:hypothetical protein
MYQNPNKYIENGIYTKLILIYKDKEIETIFDTKYLELVSKYHWRTSNKKNKVYICSGKNDGKRRLVYLQNIICNFIPDKISEIDHIDGDSLNNRKDNLRLVSRLLNIQNVSVRCDNLSSGIRGVSYDKRYGVFTVDFYYNKNRLYIKPFNLLEEAVYARFLLETMFLKEYRCINNDDKILEKISLLSDDKKIEIEEYIKNKIKEKRFNI